MSIVSCNQDWTDDTKLGCRGGLPNIENGHQYTLIKEYEYKGSMWYMVLDESDGRNIHAPKDKFN